MMLPGLRDWRSDNAGGSGADARASRVGLRARAQQQPRVLVARLAKMREDWNAAKKERKIWTRWQNHSTGLSGTDVLPVLGYAILMCHTNMLSVPGSRCTDKGYATSRPSTRQLTFGWCEESGSRRIMNIRRYALLSD
eukprot:2514729-Rhodomonas_salina.1